MKGWLLSNYLDPQCNVTLNKFSYQENFIHKQEEKECSTEKQCSKHLLHQLLHFWIHETSNENKN